MLPNTCSSGLKWRSPDSLHWEASPPTASAGSTSFKHQRKMAATHTVYSLVLLLAWPIMLSPLENFQTLRLWLQPDGFHTSCDKSQQLIHSCHLGGRRGRSVLRATSKEETWRDHPNPAAVCSSQAGQDSLLRPQLYLDSGQRQLVRPLLFLCFYFAVKRQSVRHGEVSLRTLSFPLFSV